MNQKPCPIQPCPEQISKRWAMCEFHWRMVPSQLRFANRRAGHRKDVGGVAYTAILAMCWLWAFYERVTLPLPTEHTGAWPWQGCSCRSCAPILRRALKVEGVSPEFFDHLAKRWAERGKEAA